MESAVEEIKKKLDIVSYIGSFIQLKKAGRNYKGLCPFHQEHTPSFVVSSDRQIWHCFGACQDGGDIIKFLMKWENITFIEALKELAEKAGVRLKNIQYEDRFWKKKEQLLRLNLIASEFYEYLLHKNKIGEHARDYLKLRQLNSKIAKKFQLGYAPASWDSLLKFLLKKKFSREEINESGLVVMSSSGSLYDRFRGRLVFPIKDSRENIIGFSGRTLNANEKQAKYINTPETLLYHKRETLYGINIAKEAIKKENNVFLVEGEFDVISPVQQGIENIVAIKGSAITREQLMLLKRYTNKITLVLDSDMAGEEAMKKGIQEAESLEFDIGAITFDYAKDPDEAVRIDPLRFKKTLKKPLPLYDFIIGFEQNKHPEKDPYSKKQFAEEVIVFLEKIKNPVVLSHYVKKLASLVDVSESSIEALIRNMRRKKLQRFSVTSKKKVIVELTRAIIIQKYLLSKIFQHSEPFRLADEVFKVFSPNDFSIPSHSKISQLFLDYKSENKIFDVKQFLNSLSPELKSVFDEIYLFASTDIEIKEENIEKLIYEVKRFSLKRKIADLLSKDIEKDQDAMYNLKHINQELTQVEKMIVTL